MKKMSILATLAVVNVCNLAYAASDEATQELDYRPNWSYECAKGPEKWGSLEKGYHLCKSGQEQSPIELRDAVATALMPLVFDYHPMPLYLVNINFTLEQYFFGPEKLAKAPENYLNFMNKAYRLLELHFHIPSEHTIDGEQYPMAMHLVHKSADGELAVVGVMLTPGKSNESLTQILTHIPERDYQPFYDPAITIDLNTFVSENKHYYHYRGSLTTPPCTEGVNWIVLAEPIQVSPEQIDIFKEKVVLSNARPTQALGQRQLMFSTG